MKQSRVRLAIPVLMALAYPGLASAQTVGEQTVDAMNTIWGKHPETRANHAKGVVTEGTFKPSREGARLSKATLFSGLSVPVTVRFSDSTGVPDLPDGSDLANPHGMSIKFQIQGGKEMDIVANSLKFFPVATGEEFRDLLQAIAVSGKDAAKPTKLDSFMAAHPAAPRAFGSVATPTSFARETYNGVNSFVFVDKVGRRQAFRFQIVPVAGTLHMTAAQATAQKPNFLIDELGPRLARQPVRFKLTAFLAQSGDAVDDATKPWPDNRRSIDLGTITLNKVIPADKALGFLPENLVEGIEPSGDPLIKARTQAYVVSYGRRTQ
jgi:catalase